MGDSASKNSSWRPIPWWASELTKTIAPLDHEFLDIKVAHRSTFSGSSALVKWVCWQVPQRRLFTHSQLIGWPWNTISPDHGHPWPSIVLTAILAAFKAALRQGADRTWTAIARRAAWAYGPQLPRPSHHLLAMNPRVATTTGGFGHSRGRDPNGCGSVPVRLLTGRCQARCPRPSPRQWESAM